MVNAQPATSRRIRTGVALSLTEVCAADVRLVGNRGSMWRMTIEPPDSNGGGWPSLANALRELAEALGVTGGRLAIALMPPLTEVRRLDLPPLKPEELQQLLSRNAGRYFLTAREPQFVGTTMTRRASRNGPAPIVGASASARLVNAIYAAAREAGWIVEGVVPAEIGWRVAATSLWPAFARGVSHVLVHHADRTDLLQLENGNLAGVRRFRAGAVDAELIASALQESRSNGTPPRVGSLGTLEPRQALANSLSRASADLSAPPADWSGPSADPMFVAATFVTPDEGLTLRTHDVVESRAARGRRITWSIIAATVGLLIVAAGLELWGVRRELNAVNAERAKIRPQLQTTLTGRTNFETSNRKLSALFAAHRQSPYLSGVIASVTDALPEDAYLLSFRAHRDTLVLDGLAKHAAAAFDALEARPELANVQSIAGVQRQLQEDGTALEHFTVQARMLLPVPPSTSPLRGRKP
jgi:hypothetical protein